MPTLEIIGRITHIGETVRITESFSKRTMIVEETCEYPQTFPIDFNNENIDLTFNYQVGQNVKATVNVRGKAYTNKSTQLPSAFLSFAIWKMESLDHASKYATPQPSNPPPNQSAPNQSSSEDDDLPFLKRKAPILPYWGGFN